jgi:alpha-beta hydrolase superfamily lysophospholipase
MLIVHGLAEHSGRYEHVGRAFAEAAIDVEALDLRGFGRSPGPPAFIERWSDYHDDVAERLASRRREVHGRPLVLLGHSLGGLLALGYVLTDRPKPDLLILSAPAIGSSIPGWKRLAAGALNRVSPHTQVGNDLDGADLSRDPEIGKRYFADPLNRHTSSVRLGVEGFAEQQRVVASINEGRDLPVPTLVIHGEADRIVPVGFSAPLAALPNVTRLTYPDLRHELHNEPEGPAILARVTAWVLEHC